jgi:hypothetical protein
MTVYLVISLPITPCIHRMYVSLANPRNKWPQNRETVLHLLKQEIAAVTLRILWPLNLRKICNGQCVSAKRGRNSLATPEYLSLNNYCAFVYVYVSIPMCLRLFVCCTVSVLNVVKLVLPHVRACLCKAIVPLSMSLCLYLYVYVSLCVVRCQC